MPKSEEQEQLWERITLKRQEMNHAYQQDKATSNRVLSISQELDRLLNVYNKLLSQDDATENES